MTAGPKLRDSDLRSPDFMTNLRKLEEKGQGHHHESRSLSFRGTETDKNQGPSEQQSPKSGGGRRKRYFIPESVCCRVEQSWELVSDNLEELGLDFLLRLFDDCPELLSLLPYGHNYLHATDLERAALLKQSPSLRIHAIHVMTAVGNVVSGLNDIETLVPALRALGKTHRRAGVEDDHYEKLFKHLGAAIRDKLGPTHWNEETAEAWELVYFSLASIMSRPVVLLETELMRGWQRGNFIAGLYFILFAPFRLAGFSARVGYIETVLTVLDAIALIFFALDLCSGWISASLKVKPKASYFIAGSQSWRSSSLRHCLDEVLVPVKIQLSRLLRSLQIDQWIPWPMVDALVLISFPLQQSHVILRVFGLSACEVDDQPFAPAGVRLTHMFGLLRLSAAARVFHSLRCFENNIMLRQRVNQSQQTALRIIKLVVTLAYVTHLSACLWCIVARVELGPSTLDARSSEFFPEPRILMGGTGVANSYLRSVHWSWVNLAGIGNFDSTPITSLEVLVTLLVHVCGLTLYAVTMGHVVSILDEATARQNEIGTDLANIRTFMDECNVPSDVQERILQGYVMQNVISSGSAEEGGGHNRKMFESAAAPNISDAILSRVPRHMRHELTVYRRAEAMKRRDQSFQKCSPEFLFSLAGELGGTTTLLPGDYLFKEGQAPHTTFVVDSGTMEVEEDGKSTKVLRPGDMLGKPWLLAASVKGTTYQQLDVSTAEAPAIRALSECSIATGLSIKYEVQALRRRFPKDFNILEEEQGRVLVALKRIALAKNVVRAQIRMKRRLKHARSE